MGTTTTRYAVLIQTEPRREYQSLTGWDETFATRAEAEACAARAMRHDWYAAKVIEIRDA